MFVRPRPRRQGVTVVDGTPIVSKTGNNNALGPLPGRYTGAVPRQFSSSRPLSELGRLVVALCEKRKIIPSRLENVFGSKKRMSYVLRPTPVRGTGRKTPPLTYDELSHLAQVLRADTKTTQRIQLLGLLESAPPELRACVRRLMTVVRELSEDKKRSPPPLYFGPEQDDLPPLLG